MRGLGSTTTPSGVSVPTELVARLEAASVGGPDLDMAVAIATGQAPTGEAWFRRDRAGFPGEPVRAALLERHDGVPGPWPMYIAPLYSRSLDAALSLANRIRWRVRSMDASIDGRFSWCLQSRDPMPGVDEETGAIMSGIDFRYGTGRTPALALCAAVMKARTASSPGIGAADEPSPSNPPRPNTKGA